MAINPDDWLANKQVMEDENHVLLQAALILLSNHHNSYLSQLMLQMVHLQLSLSL
jgi:hypothetical protein